MSESSQIEAVTLDAHGVLVLPDPAAMRDALQAFGCSVDDSRYWRAHYEMTVLLDEMRPTDYEQLNRAFAAALGLPVEVQEVAAPVLRDVYLSTRWVPAPGAIGAVRSLVVAGLGIAVISNTTHGEIESVLARAGICEVGHAERGVSIVVDSEVVGVRKPDPVIFQLALDQLGIVPGRAVHVGDSVRDDVNAAMAIGMGAVHVDPLGRCLNEGHVHTASLAAWGKLRHFRRESRAAGDHQALADD